jgi:HEAT repeat protein
MSYFRKTKTIASLFGLLLCAFAPSFGVLGRALAGDAEYEGGMPDPNRRTRALLAAIPKDPNVLVNVSRADLPASPDILNLGRRSTGALARCVSDNVDDGVRAICASVLGSLGDRRGLPALQEALEAWDPWVRGAAITALRQIPDKSSFPALSQVLGREDEVVENRILALLTLGSLSDQRAVKVLRAALRNAAAPELRGAAFRGIWSSRHLFARNTLVDDVKYALSSQDGELVVHATHASAELKDPGLVAALVPLMGNADPRVRNRAVYALGRIGDKAATSALLKEIPRVRDARMLNNIAFALERLDSAAFYGAIRALASHKQASIRMNAAFVLGDVRRPEGVPLLTKALSDQNDFVRVSALSALGKLDAPEALPVVEPYTRDKNRTLRNTALFSVLALSKGQKRDLVYDTLVAPRPADPFAEQARLEAVLALAALGDARVTGAVLDCLDQYRCPERQVGSFLLAQRSSSVGGRLLLGWAKGRNDLADLVAALKPTGAGLLAASEIESGLGYGRSPRLESAMDLAGAVGEPLAKNALVRLVSHENTDVRLHAAVALSRLGDTNADGRLFAELDNLPQSELSRAAALIATVSESPVRARLAPKLDERSKRPETPLALASAAVLLEWQPEQTVFRFLDALAAPSVEERELGFFYLKRDTRPLLTSLLRRALAREQRPYVRDTLRVLLDARPASAGTSS